MRGDLLAVELRLRFVRNQQDDDIAAPCGLVDGADLDPVGGRARAVFVVAVTDHDGDSRVTHVEALRAPLNAVADDGHRLAGQHRQVGVRVVVHCGHGSIRNHRWTQMNTDGAERYWELICVSSVLISGSDNDWAARLRAICHQLSSTTPSELANSAKRSSSSRPNGPPPRLFSTFAPAKTRPGGSRIGTQRSVRVR